MSGFILDTHTFIWLATGSEKLSKRAKEIIFEEDEIYLSVASVWEMAIKYKLDKLQIPLPFPQFIAQELMKNETELLQIKLDHLFHLGNLERHHKDPFDRLLVSQSFVEKMPLISTDHLLDLYEVERIW